MINFCGLSLRRFGGADDSCLKGILIHQCILKTMSMNCRFWDLVTTKAEMFQYRAVFHQSYHRKATIAYCWIWSRMCRDICVSLVAESLTARGKGSDPGKRIDYSDLPLPFIINHELRQHFSASHADILGPCKTIKHFKIKQLQTNSFARVISYTGTSISKSISQH